jgi:hypothetical protein
LGALFLPEILPGIYHGILDGKMLVASDAIRMDISSGPAKYLLRVCLSGVPSLVVLP